MQYSPKLKKAMEQIKAIIKENDIAAVVVLHTPGFAEYTLQLEPSYSCAYWEDRTKTASAGLRVRARLQEDFKGDKEAWTKKVTDTVNMFDILSYNAGGIGLELMKVFDGLKKFVDIERRPGNHSGHVEQNN